MMQITFVSNVCFSIAPVYLESKINKQSSIETAGGSFCVSVSVCFLKLLPMKHEERGERAFRWPSLKRSPPVSDVIYYLKRSGMFRKTERRLKNDKMKVFIRTAFLSGLFDLSEEILRADTEIKCENTTDESVCVLFIQLKEYYITILLSLWWI